MISLDPPPRVAKFPLGDWTALIALSPLGHTSVSYLDPGGKAFKRLPASEPFAREDVDALKARRADIDAALAEARKRLELTWRTGRDWRFGDWRARYPDHPLIATLAARLLWRFEPRNRAPFVAFGTASDLHGPDGETHAAPEGDCRVKLWHPLMETPETNARWRAALTAGGLRQPIRQLWRPVYRLTEAELATATYSNRFAGLILNQPVFVRILRNRGWALHSRMLNCVPKKFHPARLDLPGFGLVAEFWGRGCGAVQENHGGYAAPNFANFATSQIRFYRAAEINGADARPVALENVPALAFAEVLFDIDTVTGASVLGLDPQWADPGAEAEPPPPEFDRGALGIDDNLSLQAFGESAILRAEMLEWLVPKLAIAGRCRMEHNHLIVSGEWHSYAIHCGNAAVRIVGKNQHVCIVRGEGGGDLGGVPLPFAGDDVLSLILSKAQLLCDETKIKDRVILNQIAL
ncbi:hypothetical protein M2323_004151 [Rhodoblastus acidophilus]|uniref:DUF4132 domain-containing protein n=1 Tax=Rhodoblastus acidophilus TaxID=1074 RepID=UPI0022255A6F|nr:DUF4132 domain-containing protein [Rhodoblastus acidophilus]MCW2286310.1 hypothetical protein [Rhodoblastus acidophilus]MCW2335205.1 hypothetical protein [Rhodoblastus acidophilus]